jgi:hypothetical protein
MRSRRTPGRLRRSSRRAVCSNDVRSEAPQGCQRPREGSDWGMLFEAQAGGPQR